MVEEWQVPISSDLNIEKTDNQLDIFDLDDDKKRCKECKKRFLQNLSQPMGFKSSMTSNRCETILYQKPCTPNISKKSFDSVQIRKTVSQSKCFDQYRCPSHQSAKSQLKTCINCGHYYKSKDLSMSVHSAPSKCMFHKPQSKSCKSSMTNYLASDKYSQPTNRNNACDYCSNRNSQEFPATSRSKYLQLNQQQSFQSTKSLVPCQSYNQCDMCEKIIFAPEVSCTSFDYCNKCKRSALDCSESFKQSPSRDLKGRIINLH